MVGDLHDYRRIVMTDQELIAANGLWFQLVEWLKNNCSTEGLTFRQISEWSLPLNGMEYEQGKSKSS